MGQKGLRGGWRAVQCEYPFQEVDFVQDSSTLRGLMRAMTENATRLCPSDPSHAPGPSRAWWNCPCWGKWYWVSACAYNVIMVI
jgi:hypothetical protein